MDFPQLLEDNLNKLSDHAKAAWDHSYATKTIIVITSFLALRYVLAKIYHKKECIASKETPCKYHELGCKMMVNSQTKEKHEKEAAGIHLGFALDQLKKV